MPRESLSLKGDKELTQDNQTLILKDKVIHNIKSPGMLFCFIILFYSSLKYLAKQMFQWLGTT